MYNVELSVVCPENVYGGQGNPFLFVLNGVGILGSGVLAALYASLKKEKAESEATVESVSSSFYMFAF